MLGVIFAEGYVPSPNQFSDPDIWASRECCTLVRKQVYMDCARECKRRFGKKVTFCDVPEVRYFTNEEHEFFPRRIQFVSKEIRDKWIAYPHHSNIKDAMEASVRRTKKNVAHAQNEDAGGKRGKLSLRKTFQRILGAEHLSKEKNLYKMLFK